MYMYMLYIHLYRCIYIYTLIWTWWLKIYLLKFVCIIVESVRMCININTIIHKHTWKQVFIYMSFVWCYSFSSKRSRIKRGSNERSSIHILTDVPFCLCAQMFNEVFYIYSFIIPISIYACIMMNVCRWFCKMSVMLVCLYVCVCVSSIHRQWEQQQ